MALFSCLHIGPFGIPEGSCDNFMGLASITQELQVAFSLVQKLQDGWCILGHLK